MKKIITTLTLAIITSALALASTPDSMYVHCTGTNGDSIVVFAIANVDSIVYYAPPPILVPTLSTTAASDITAEGATLGGDITTNGGATVSARGITYSLTENFAEGTGTQITASTNGTGTYSVSLTSLEANTVYYYKAYATNTAGTSYGDQLNFTTSAADPDYTQPSGTFIDSRDTKTYNWVTIGEQIWMAENLAYLPQVDDNSTFGGATDARYGIYGYDGTDVNSAKDSANYTTYGVMYNWYAAMAGASSSDANPSGVQGICPTGWHLPSDAEWTALEDALIGENKGSQLADSADLWDDGNLKTAIDEFGTSGFAALPGGTRYHTNGAFFSIGQTGSWWTTSDVGIYSYAYYISKTSRDVEHHSYPTSRGFSVRCVKD